MLASARSGRRANFSRRNRSVPSLGRWYIHDCRPSANMFLDRSASFLDNPVSASAPIVRVAMATSCTWYCSSEESSSGFAAYPTFVRLRLLNSSVLTISTPPGGRSAMLALSAAGFIATSTSGRSPGVRMS